MKNKLIIGTMTLSMLTSMVPASVSAASVKAPAKVTIKSATRTSSSKAKVKWKKLKKTPSGYAVYQKKGSSSWKLVKRASKSSDSATVSAKSTEKNQFKVRAYKTYKVKKYYNKKTKKYVSKKAYNKLAKKNRAIKKITAYKYGKYSAIKTINAVKTETTNTGDTTKTDDNIKPDSGKTETKSDPIELTNVTSNSYYDQSARRYARIQVAYDHKIDGMDSVEYMIERAVAGTDNYETLWVLNSTDEGELHFYCKTDTYNGKEIFILRDYGVAPNTAYTYRVTATGTKDNEATTIGTYTIDTPADNLNGRIETRSVKTQGRICRDCYENLTGEDESAHETTYYCSVCGDIKKARSHNKNVIEEHIAKSEGHENAEVLCRAGVIKDCDDYTKYDFYTHTPEWVELSPDDEYYEDVVRKAKVMLIDDAKIYVDKYEKEAGLDKLGMDCFTKYIIIGGLEK